MFTKVQSHAWVANGRLGGSQLSLVFYFIFSRRSEARRSDVSLQLLRQICCEERFPRHVQIPCHLTSEFSLHQVIAHFWMLLLFLSLFISPCSTLSPSQTYVSLGTWTDHKLTRNGYKSNCWVVYTVSLSRIACSLPLPLLHKTGLLSG